MILINILLRSIPGAISVRNVGGTYEVETEGGFRPVSDAELLTATKDAAIATNRAEANRRIEAKWPIWRQTNVGLGVYVDPAISTEMRDNIAAVVSAENEAADRIDAATTVAEVEAVVVNWPVI